MTLRYLAILTLFVSSAVLSGPAPARADLAPGGAAHKDPPSEAPAGGVVAEAPGESSASTESPATEDYPAVDGPGTGHLGTEATLMLPAGVTLLEAKKSIEKFYELSRNTVTGHERGVVLPSNGEAWWIDFSFDASGYVKDDEQEELDADAILKGLQESQRDGNAARRAKGWDDLEIVGWHTPPKYDAKSHNLEWGVRVKSPKGESINYEVRLLGRRGVMSATLMAAPDAIDTYLGRLRSLLDGFAFVGGEDYASYQEGDKLAEYGLSALIGGGALAVAAKTGLLGKFWKFIVAGIAAIGAFASRIFGKKKSAVPPPPSYGPPSAPEDGPSSAPQDGPPQEPPRG